MHDLPPMVTQHDEALAALSSVLDIDISERTFRSRLDASARAGLDEPFFDRGARRRWLGSADDPDAVFGWVRWWADANEGGSGASMSAQPVQRENGNWCVRWRWRGVPGRIAVEDEAQARALAAEIKAAHKAGHNEPVRRWRARHPAEGPPSLSDVMADYLESLQRRGRADSTVYAVRNMLHTLLRYLRTLRPEGKLVPQLLSEARIEAYVDWNRERDLRESTIYRYVATVEAFWEWAHRREKWSSWVPPPRSAELPPPPPSEIRALTWSQIDRAIEVCPTISRLSPWIAPGLTVARFTGLRLGQMWRLTWEDVVGLGTEEPELVIRPQLGKSRREKIGRRFPLSEPFAEWLRERRAPTGFIVAPEMRRRWATSGRLALPSGRPLHRVWKAAQIDPEIVARRPFHILRKAFETELTRRRATGLAVDYLLGHAPRGVGSSVYLDMGWGLRDQVAEAVALIPPLGQADDFGRARKRADSASQREAGGHER